MDPLVALLERSQAFEDRLGTLLAGIGVVREDARALAAGRAASLGIEHGRAVRVLFGLGTPNSAASMLRVQYEAVLRGAWALYAANATQAAKLNEPLDLASEQAAKNLPGAELMLKALLMRAQAQPGLGGIVIPLEEIREHHWRAMNSFVHGGIHPLQRSAHGFPTQLAADVVRNSNGITHLAFRLLTRLAVSGQPLLPMERAWIDFEDCCPMKPGSPHPSSGA